MALELYTDVMVITDRYAEDGVAAGDIGTIVEIWDGGAAYEIDFAKNIPGGTISVYAEDLVSAEPGAAP